jgi:RHS repeat-associated protein
MTTDQNGNTLVYDAWNRLVTVKNASGQTIANYTYDAVGYRISETYPQGGSGIPAGTTKYLYYSNNWQVIETRWNGTAASNVQHQYVWSQMYIDAMVLRDSYTAGTLQTNARIYTQFDANYNVTALVGYNASTQTWGVVQRFTYTPYGTATVLDANWNPTTDQFAWQYMHQGGRLDPVTGLYLFRHRDYSPTLGNWIEQDPAGYVDGGNRYAALASAPAAWTDPRGLAHVLSASDKENLAIAIATQMWGEGKVGLDGWKPRQAELFVGYEVYVKRAYTLTWNIAKFFGELPLKVVWKMSGGGIAKKLIGKFLLPSAKGGWNAYMKALQKHSRQAFGVHWEQKKGVGCGPVYANLVYVYNQRTHRFAGVITGRVPSVEGSGVPTTGLGQKQAHKFVYEFSGQAVVRHGWFGNSWVTDSKLAAGTWRYNHGT